MGQEFLIDTNIVIYVLRNQLPEKGSEFLATLPPVISDITRIELLGWYHASSEDLRPLYEFVGRSTILPLTEEVVRQTIQLKQLYKIKLGDAMIAATAIVHRLSLITRNIDDFRALPNLTYVNPFSL